MSFIESQTTDTWHPVGGVRASAARDLMTYDVPAHELTHPEYEVILQRTEEADRFQDLWRHEGATGITRVFGIRIAGLDKSISGIGYHHPQEGTPPASTMDAETSSAGGRGKANGTRGRGGPRKKPSTASVGTPQRDPGQATRGRRGHARTKSTAQ